MPSAASAEASPRDLTPGGMRALAGIALFLGLLPILPLKQGFGMPAAVLLAGAFVLWQGWPAGRAWRQWLLVAVGLLYLIAQLSAGWYHGARGLSAPGALGLVYMLVGAVAFGALGLHMARVPVLAGRWLAVGVALSCGALGWEYLLHAQPGACRVAGGAMHPNLAAGMLPPLVILAVILGGARAPRWAAAGPLALVALATAALIFTGARMALYSFALAVLLLGALRRHAQDGREWTHVPRFLPLTAALVAGWGAGLLADHLKGCDLGPRIADTVTSVLFVANTVDSLSDAAPLDAWALEVAGMPASEGERLALWKTALTLARHAPLRGFGPHLETELAYSTPERWAVHFHNQPLSWMIWGGVGMLAAGLLLQLAPVLLSPRPVAMAMVLLPWWLALGTDSLLRWTEMTAGYIFLILLALPLLSRAAVRAPPSG
ncbi:MAG: O-antigen ligase family protein [Rhodobacteraceae bacterium]|nr:O-antigen ligase family protein [Paracoccaceae bacterium]